MSVFERRTLANGLRVLTAPLDHAQSVACFVMLRHSKFDPDEIEREKGVILEEMNMYVDTPRDHIGTVYETLLFGDNPLGWETLGTKETIKSASRDTFIDYVDEWYTPERMVVGVSGNVG